MAKVRRPDRSAATVGGAEAGLRIRLFGPVAATSDGEPVDLGPRRQRAVLAILALTPRRVVAIDRLTDAIWGDEPPDASRNTLQVWVGGLRRAVPGGAALIRTVDPGYVLDVQPDAVDLVRFERLLDDTKRPATRDELQTALDLSTQDALADLADLPFAGPLVVRITERRLRALEDRIDLDLDRGQSGSLLDEIEARLANEPYRERLWRQLMLALYRSGRQADALDAYRRARRRLRDDLGLEPGPALVALERAILVQDPALDAPVAEPRTPAPLPTPPTPTTGRSIEIATILEAVASSPVTTILGPGGVGKTRVAIEVGWAAGEMVDGVAFVDLAAIRDRRSFIAELASALGAPDSADDVAGIRVALRDRRALVILDNTEQIAGAGQVVAEILAGGVAARFLVTSRSALRIRAERVVPLPPLPVDTATGLLTSLVGAATGREPEPAVARDIAELLDGLPLAMELAAAAARTLSTDGVLQRLREHQPLPVAMADGPERQRSIAALVAWSLELLGDTERTAIDALTVLRAPFTADAGARWIAAATNRATSASEAQATLGVLVDASLLIRDGSEHRMLQPIRDVLLARLDPAAATDLDDRHAAWVAAEAAAGEAALHGGDERTARAALLRLLPDLRAAFDRLVATGENERAARVVLDVAQIWFQAGRLHEAERALARVDGATALTARTRAETSAMRGVFAKMIGDGDPDAAEAWMTMGIASLRETAPKAVALVNTLCHLADFMLIHGRTDRALELADDAVAAAYAADDPGSVAMALDLAGYVALAAGDRDRAIAAARASVAEARREDSFLLADALAGLAGALGRSEPTSAAIAWEALERAESGGQPTQRAKVIVTVADVLGAIDPGQAALLLAEAFAVYLGMASIPASVDAGGQLVRYLDPALAETARVIGAVLRLAGPEPAPELLAVADRCRRELGEAVFAHEAGRGAALGPDELSRVVASLTRAASPTGAPTGPSPDGEERPRPERGLFARAAPIAHHADEHLQGLGER